MVPRCKTTTALLVGATLLPLLLSGGCGSGSQSDAASAPALSASEFPAPEGRTLQEIVDQEATQSDDVAMPTSQAFTTGENRFGFGLFSIDFKPITDAQVAIYFAKPDGEAIGPFPAKAQSLATSPAFESKSTATDPDAAKVVYTTEVDFPDRSKWPGIALIRNGDGSFGYSTIPGVTIGRGKKIPAVGDRPPAIHTPTAEDVGGNLVKIDTRQPPSNLHEQDFADVLGKEPVVLLFSTPALCTSRVCGPVADITDEVKSERPDDAAYIQMEIYNENSVQAGLRPQVKAFNLKTEPWLFVIGSNGKISTRIEGAFSKQELEAALDKVS